MLESIKDFTSNVDVSLELGEAYKDVGQYSRSINLLENTLILATEVHGAESLQVARLGIRLYAPYQRYSRYAEAKNLLEHSLANLSKP